MDPLRREAHRWQGAERTNTRRDRPGRGPHPRSAGGRTAAPLLHRRALGGRAASLALAGLLLLAGPPPPARADPILSPPVPGRGALRDSDGVRVGLLAELHALAAIAADALAALPDYGAIDVGHPELGLARLGLVVEHPCRPVVLVIRVDAGELLRIDASRFSEETAAAVDAVIDDAALWWTPAAWANLVVGRAPVPFSRFRQLDRPLLSVGLVPFSIDRIAPDRRWGLSALGDLGAIAFAGGFYADADRLELARADDDPSAHGRAAMALHLEWTPRAPIGDDHRATPSADPWYDEVRVSAGAGALYRLRAEGGNRLDLSLGGQIKYQRYAAIAELTLGSEAAALSLGGAGELGVVLADRWSLFARADYDAGVDLYSAGGGASYFVSRDRRSQIGVYGWVRRAVDAAGARRDGAVVELQAAL